MSTINHVFEVGFLTRSAEVKTSATGLEVVTFSIAVHSRIKSSQDESGYITVANFFDCVAFGKYFASVAKSMQKGRKVAVCGELRQNRYEKDGVQHRRIEIAVNEIDVFPAYTKTDSSEVNTVAEVFEGQIQEQQEIF